MTSLLSEPRRPYQHHAKGPPRMSTTTLFYYRNEICEIAASEIIEWEARGLTADDRILLIDHALDMLSDGWSPLGEYVPLDVKLGRPLIPVSERARRITFSEMARELLIERDGGQCVECHATDDLTIDHRVPLARGGTNSIDNLQVLCRSCNSRKGAMR